MVGKKYSTNTGYWRFVVEIHHMLRFFGEWCFIRWGRSSKKLISMFCHFLVCFVFSPKEGLRSSQVNIMLARRYSVPAEWWDFKLLWGWESVLALESLPSLEIWRWMVGIQSFPFGTMGRPIFRCKLAVSFRVPCQLETIFSQGEPSRSPTSSTTMPPWLHVTCSGKKWGAYEVSSWCFELFFEFSPLFGEDFQFSEHIFQMGWFNHQPEFGFMILLNGQTGASDPGVFPCFLSKGLWYRFCWLKKSGGCWNLGWWFCYTLED